MKAKKEYKKYEEIWITIRELIKSMTKTPDY